VSDIPSALLSLSVIVGIAFAVLPLFSRTRSTLAPATIALLVVLTGFAVLVSVSVGPIDISPMLFWVPLNAGVVTVWYFWKIKPRETGNG
jgi:hypothetical protein